MDRFLVSCTFIIQKCISNQNSYVFTITESLCTQCLGFENDRRAINRSP